MGNNFSGEKRAVGKESSTEKAVCRHHWYINRAGQGVCQKCGEKKDFSTALPVKTWQERTPRNIVDPPRTKENDDD